MLNQTPTFIINTRQRSPHATEWDLFRFTKLLHRPSLEFELGDSVSIDFRPTAIAIILAVISVMPWLRDIIGAGHPDGPGRIP
jgi:hypothetical protein